MGRSVPRGLVQSIWVVERVWPPEHRAARIYGQSASVAWPCLNDLRTTVCHNAAIRERQVPKRLMPRCKARGESAGLTEIGIELKMMDLGFLVTHSRVQKYHRLGGMHNRVNVDTSSFV